MCVIAWFFPSRGCRVCVCAGVMLLEKTGWENVSGSSSHKDSLVMAFHSSRSLFTALGWCCRSVQVISYPSTPLHEATTLSLIQEQSFVLGWINDSGRSLVWTCSHWGLHVACRCFLVLFAAHQHPCSLTVDLLQTQTLGRGGGFVAASSEVWIGFMPLANVWYLSPYCLWRLGSRLGE